MTEEVLVSYEGPLQIVRLNRPARRNAFTLKTYSLLKNILKSALENDQIKITLITGVGDYFSSGNDFSQSNATVDEDFDMAIRNHLAYPRELIRALIEYPKIIIGLVNGPAIGVAVTMLGLFDLVYALDTATFQTPFSSLGLAAEGCSTYTFPRMLGKSLASKMLYFNYTMSATESKSCGFIADILTQDQIPKFMNDLKQLAEAPLKSLISTKQMLRSHEIKALHYANSIEMETLVTHIQSEDFMNHMMNMFQKKNGRSKL